MPAPSSSSIPESAASRSSERSARSLGSTLTTVVGSRVVNDVRVYGGHAQLSPISPIGFERVQAADTLTLVAAAHEIKAGFDTRLDEPAFGDVRATSVFLQDEWQATSDFTLNVGVRRDDQFVAHWNPRIGGWFVALILRLSRYVSANTVLVLTSAIGAGLFTLSHTQ